MIVFGTVLEERTNDSQNSTAILQGEEVTVDKSQTEKETRYNRTQLANGEGIGKDCVNDMKEEKAKWGYRRYSRGLPMLGC